MTFLKNENFAYSLLASGITNVDTAITVTSGDGLLFPDSGYFMAVLWDGAIASPGLDVDRELIKCTFTSGDTFTISRGEEGTNNRAWSASDNIALVMTAGKIDELEEKLQNGITSFEVATGTNTYSMALSPYLGAYASGIIVRTKFNNASTNTVTLNINALGGKKVYALVDGSLTALGADHITDDFYATLLFDSSLDSAAGGWVIVGYEINTKFAFIDQDVTSGSSPTFDASNMTNVFPSGGIIMWSGSIATIPSGWYLCDGNNSTPNLTDRFVIHADADSGGTNDVDDTGGSNTISEAELPSHSHGDGTLATDSDSHSHGDGSLYTNTTGSHSHGGTYLVTGDEGNLHEDNYDTDRRSMPSAGDHSHTIHGNTDSDSHSHVVHGDTDSDTHSHGVGGDTGSTGSGSDYKPRYYALAYIMKG